MSDKKIVACGLDLDDISSLAETVKKNKLGKIKIKNGDSEIVIEAEKKYSPAPMPAAFPVMGGMPAQNVPAAAQTEASSSSQADDDTSGGNLIKSPIVGTYYASPSPDKPPFVKVGDTVKKGDVIMIIESMKLMNEVQSDFSGTVKKILVNNGDAVEFDQPIMIIE